MGKRFLTGVLLRCTLYGFALLFVWFGAFMLLGDRILAIHQSMFDVTRHEFDVMNYCGLGLVKMFVVMVFLVPYLAIRFPCCCCKSQESGEQERSE